MTPFPMPLTTPPDTRIYFVILVCGMRPWSVKGNDAALCSKNRKFACCIIFGRSSCGCAPFSSDGTQRFIIIFIAKLRIHLNLSPPIPLARFKFVTARVPISCLLLKSPSYLKRRKKSICNLVWGETPSIGSGLDAKSSKGCCWNTLWAYLQVENTAFASGTIKIAAFSLINNAQLDDFLPKGLLNTFLDQVIVFDFVLLQLIPQASAASTSISRFLGRS